MQGYLCVFFILEGSSQFGLHHSMEYCTALRISDLHLLNSMRESTVGDNT